LREQSFLGSVITAAPNARECVHPLFNRAISGKLKNRLRKVMQIAADHGNRVLVLGAFGCGVFENKPETVAIIERELLAGAELRYLFDFALNPITPARIDRANFLAFKEVFAGLDAVDGALPTREG
jgi:uncharacterized protein (TIGR02452 family)